MNKNLVNNYKQDNVHLSNIIQSLEQENENLIAKIKNLEHNLDKSN